jgi:hypothetical protein
MSPRMAIHTASRFSVLVFGPVFIALLLPALFLLPGGVLFTLIAISDHTVPLSSAISYDMWILGPVLITSGLFFAGRGLYSIHLYGNSPRDIWLATWVVFSVLLYIALWIAIIILTSVGASETPMHIFMGITALFAAGLVLPAQVVVVPWLVFVSRMFPEIKL